MLNHVLALPNDKQRVLVITEGLNQLSLFSRLLERKRRPYVHHMAMEVADVDAAFRLVRATGWKTTAEQVSHDMLTGLRQFFIGEEEVGCFVELIERADGKAQTDALANDETNAGISARNAQGEFAKENMASLAQSMHLYVGSE
jgi:hypothetical protein